MKSLSSVKLVVERYAIVAAPPRLIETHVELARQIEKFLDRFYETVQLVVPVRIVVNNFQPLAKMRERVDIVRRVRFAVALDILDHLAPHPRVALDLEIDLLQIDRRHFADILEIENLELEHEVARLAVEPDADPEGRVDKPQPPELLLVRSHLRLERLEIFRRRKANRHNSMNPAGLQIN